MPTEQTLAGRPCRPVRLTQLERGERVVLPSPNGSTCAALATARGATVVASCLRNSRAVADWLNSVATSVAVIACGERWPDGSLRPSLEDYLGAAAVIAGLSGSRSAEAEVAALVWESSHGRVAEMVRACASGRELIERGWGEDLDYACEPDVSDTVPVLSGGGYSAAIRA